LITSENEAGGFIWICSSPFFVSTRVSADRPVAGQMLSTQRVANVSALIVLIAPNPDIKVKKIIGQYPKKCRSVSGAFDVKLNFLWH
jgi:hypothetical protein